MLWEQLFRRRRCTQLVVVVHVFVFVQEVDCDAGAATRPWLPVLDPLEQVGDGGGYSGVGTRESSAMTFCSTPGNEAAYYFQLEAARNIIAHFVTRREEVTRTVQPDRMASWEGRGGQSNQMM